MITWVLNSEIFFEWWIPLFHSSFQFCEKISLPNSQENRVNLEKMIWYAEWCINFAFLTHLIHVLAYQYVKQRWYVALNSLTDKAAGM